MAGKASTTHTHHEAKPAAAADVVSARVNPAQVTPVTTAVVVGGRSYTPGVSYDDVPADALKAVDRRGLPFLVAKS